MKTSKFNESQICNILKQQKSGMKVADICREYGISTGTFYKWRSRFGGMDASMIKENKSLREENTRLKKMYADSQLDQMILKEALSKKW